MSFFLLLGVSHDCFGALENLVLTHCHGELEEELPVHGLDVIERHSIRADDAAQNIIDAINSLLFFQFSEELL